MEHRDLVIVGGGPGGTGTALALAQVAPELARRCLLLDRAVFPRDKTCAGGLIPRTIDLLDELGVPLSVPHVRVDRAHVEAGGPTIRVDARGCCHVIRRREFDAMLLAAARERGVEVRQGVRVEAAWRDGEQVRLRTTQGEIQARAVVGADGAGSLIRRSLVDARPAWLARATMSDVPIDGQDPPGWYEFDFRAVPEGLAGYRWAFPCLIDGRLHWNVGVYSVRREAQGERLSRLIDERTGRPGLARKAHPIGLYRWRARISAPGVLLVGDAAGVDPLLGEGISYSLEYGRHAARALADGFARGDLGFRAYSGRVRRSPMGTKLARLALMTHLFYGSTSRFWFGVARASSRAQQIGMDWYNGVAR